MLDRRVAGLLLAPTGGDHSWLRPDRTPLVLIDRAAPGVSADLVDIDDRQAADHGVTHLIEHGHRRIAYVGDTSSIPTSSARLDGFLAAHALHGLPVADDLVRSSSSSSRDAAAACTSICTCATGCSTVHTACRAPGASRSARPARTSDPSRRSAGTP